MHVVLEAVLVLEVANNLSLNEARGNGDLNELNKLVDDLVASFCTLAEDLRLLGLNLEVRLELVDGVERAGDLSEVVVGVGKLALLDREQRDGDQSGLALLVTAKQLRLEGGALTGGEGVEGLVDALDELAGTDLVADAVRGVDFFVTNGGDEVELGEVAGLGGAVNGDERAEAAAQVVELSGHIVVADNDGSNFELEAGVVGEVELGANVNLDRQQQVAAEVLDLGPRGDVGLGTTQNADLLLGDGLAVELVHSVADGVVEHFLTPDALVNQLRRHLALAEAGNVDRLGEVGVRVIDARTQLLGRHSNNQLDAGGAQLLDRGLHVGVLLMFVVLGFRVVSAGLCRGDRS